jgi:hypothetical protein
MGEQVAALADPELREARHLEQIREEVGQRQVQGQGAVVGVDLVLRLGIRRGRRVHGCPAEAHPLELGKKKRVYAALT